MGATDGLPVTCDWSPPSPIPATLPWIALLILLALRPNRTAQAWLIFAPVLLLSLAPHGFQFLLSFMGSDQQGTFFAAFNTFCFGLAAAWLLAPFLAHPNRFVALLKTTPVVVAVATVATVPHLEATDAPAVVIVLIAAIACTIGTTALFLASLAARHRYRPLAFALSSLLAVFLLWTLFASPFVAIAAFAGQISNWSEVLQPIAAFATLTCLPVLALLLLSFLSPFYRTRLQILYHLNPPTPAATAAEPPPPPATSTPAPSAP